MATESPEYPTFARNGLSSQAELGSARLASAELGTRLDAWTGAAYGPSSSTALPVWRRAVPRTATDERGLGRSPWCVA